MDNKIKMTPDEAKIILDKRQRFLQKKRECNVRYRTKDIQAFNAAQAIYHKKYYDKNKELLITANNLIGDIPVILPIVKDTIYKLPENTEPVIIKTVIPSYITNNTNKGVSQASVDKYLKIINNIHTKYTNNTLDDDILTKVFNGNYTKIDEKYISKNIPYISTKNIDNFIQYMKDTYINTNTLHTYILPYIIITSYISKYKQSYQKLSKLNLQCNDNYTNIRSQNILIDTQKIISFNPIKINEVLNDNSNFPDKKYKLVYAIYTLIVPRRAEISSLILTDILNIDMLNDENYIVIDNKNGYKLIFNKYKTANKFHKQIIEVSTQLKQIIDEYIKEYKVVIGNPLFSNKNVPISNATMGALVKKVFSYIFNTPLTINDIRMSASTYNDSLNLSLADDTKFSILMAHSYIVDKMYVRKVC
jgi:hypothetical protein